jgi:hypothetical protein
MTLTMRSLRQLVARSRPGAAVARAGGSGIQGAPSSRFAAARQVVGHIGEVDELGGDGEAFDVCAVRDDPERGAYGLGTQPDVAARRGRG